MIGKKKAPEIQGELFGLQGTEGQEDKIYSFYIYIDAHTGEPVISSYLALDFLGEKGILSEKQLKKLPNLLRKYSPPRFSKKRDEYIEQLKQYNLLIYSKLNEI